MEEKKNVQKIIIPIAVIIIVLIVIGSSYAYFSAIGRTSVQEVSIAKMDVVFTEGNSVNLTDILPTKEYEIESDASSISFTLENKGDVLAQSEIRLTNITISDELKNSYFKWRLLENDVAINEGDFIGVNNAMTLTTVDVEKSTKNNYKLLIWLQENYDNQNSLQEKSLKTKITVNSYLKNNNYEENGVNAPELEKGMIPVVYNEIDNDWEKADITKEWYSYNKRNWANAVTVSEESRKKYVSASAGTKISMSDINGMWVWIPRFKYKIASNIGSESDVLTPSEIEVVFEEGIQTTGVDEATYRSQITSDGTNTNYYTHPAFRDGSIVYRNMPFDTGGWNYELTGFWIGKFETSTDTAQCYDIEGRGDPIYEEWCSNVDPIIKPDIRALKFQDVSTQFMTSIKFSGGTMNTETGEVTYSGNDKYGLEASTVSHMAKTTEWSAVAYLSQSKYGKYGNENYLGSDKEVYLNNSGFDPPPGGETSSEIKLGHYTGRSGGSYGGNTAINNTYPDQSSTLQYNNWGFYSYNGFLIDFTSNVYDFNTLNVLKGIGASTTGTIYGVYDMSGGAWEYTMGNWYGYTGASATRVNMAGFNEYTSDFNGLLSEGGVITDRVEMPEDKYYDHYIGINTNGVMTKELAILGDGTWETMRWYSDWYYTVEPAYPWIVKGGTYAYGAYGGVFATNGNRGAAYHNNSWRAILIP